MPTSSRVGGGSCGMVSAKVRLVFCRRSSTPVIQSSRSEPHWRLDERRACGRPRSELFTDSRRGHTGAARVPRVREAPDTGTSPAFPQCRDGARLLCVLDARVSRGRRARRRRRRRRPDAGAEPQAPPPLSKPPRLLRFVEATPPASLGERGARRRRADHRRRRAGAGHATSRSRSRRPRRQAASTQAAVAAARQFTFEPGEAAGKPVPVRITLRLSLRAEAAARAAARRRARRAGADRAARRDRAAQGRPRPDRGRDGGGRAPRAR